MTKNRPATQEPLRGLEYIAIAIGSVRIFYDGEHFGVVIPGVGEYGDTDLRSAIHMAYEGLDTYERSIEDD